MLKLENLSKNLTSDQPNGFGFNRFSKLFSSNVGYFRFGPNLCDLLIYTIYDDVI